MRTDRGYGRAHFAASHTESPGHVLANSENKNSPPTIEKDYGGYSIEDPIVTGGKITN